MSSRLNREIICFIDDPNKMSRSIHGVPVVGNRYSIIENVQKYKIGEDFFL